VTGRSPRASVERIAVVVPTIRDPARLARCLHAAHDAARDDPIELDIVVVLDGADTALHDLMAHTTNSRTISWPERRGFAAALNAGIRSAPESRFVVVLQDDALPRSGWLRALLDVASAQDDIGVVGPLVVGTDGHVRRAGAIIGGDGRTADPWLGEPPPAEHFTTVRPVDYLSSSALLVRRTAWEEVGGFDEQLYPAVYVDADFCTALWNAGWRVLLAPESIVIHDPGGSTSERFRHFLYRRNRSRFLDTWGACFAGRPTFPTGQGDPESVGPPGAWPSIDVARCTTRDDAPETYIRREREVLLEYVSELEARLDQRAAAP
jgi:GT2 family glycosyltransferase